MSFSNIPSQEESSLDNSMVNALNALSDQISNITHDSIIAQQLSTRDIAPKIYSHHQQISFLTSQNEATQHKLPQFFSEIQNHSDTIQYILNGANGLSNRINAVDLRMNEISSNAGGDRQSIQNQLDWITQKMLEISNNSTATHTINQKMEQQQKFFEERLFKIQSELRLETQNLKQEIFHELFQLKINSEQHLKQANGSLQENLNRFWFKIERNLEDRAVFKDEFIRGQGMKHSTKPENDFGPQHWKPSYNNSEGKCQKNGPNSEGFEFGSENQRQGNFFSGMKKFLSNQTQQKNHADQDLSNPSKRYAYG
jgi:chromosome segregation ATPase